MIKIIKEIFRLSNFYHINLNDYNKLDLDDNKDKNIKNISLAVKNKKYRINNYIDNISMFVPNVSNNKIEYFIVINLKNPTISNLNKLIEYDFNSIYSYVKSIKDYKAYMEKNTSLVVLLETTERDSNFNRKVFDIEENKYNFKKYVITYTQDQLEQLQDIDSQEGDLLKKTNEIIYDKDEFIEFKSNPMEDSLYNIVSKLYIKLPFLKLNPKEEKISSLEDDIKDKFLLYEEIDKNIVKEIISLNDKDLKDLSEEKILSMVGGID